MLLRPSVADLKLVALDLGRIFGVVAVAALLPLGWGVAVGEWSAVSHLALMVGICLFLAGTAELLRPGSRGAVDWSHGMVVVALAWLLVPAVGAVPLALSGHFASWVDAYFEAVSGLTTSGLSLVNDLDHFPVALNVWRHTLHFLGGQGIVLAALVFFAAAGVRSLYQAEGRDERIFPSVGSTARFIWLVSIVHGIAGIVVLTADGVLAQGFTWDRALFHAVTIFMAAFDTGGFSPMSTSIAYYRSPLWEATVTVLMVAGALSFGLHHALWQRRPGLWKNLEVRTILATFGVILAVTIVGLGVVFEGAWPLTRRALFHVVSAHTGTGFATVSSSELARWSGLAYLGVIVAMALGGMSSSTAGGVKSLRIGLTLKAMANTVREVLLPERTVIPTGYYQYGHRRLSPELAQSVMAISLLYVGLYLLGAAVAYALGYDLDQALFESVSAAANVGLSVGITSPDMPLLLKLTMIGQMWVGRLEFVAVFALAGFAAAWLVGE
ncbi:MAG: potassium transporter [Acidimicrobiia bacterium]|nr:MAG: potassium transporter [Acidimicrobiia bacterium]